MDKLKIGSLDMQNDGEHLRCALQEAVGGIVNSFINGNTTTPSSDMTGKDASKHKILAYCKFVYYT